jgi:hypothetical protein
VFDRGGIPFKLNSDGTNKKMEIEKQKKAQKEPIKEREERVKMIIEKQKKEEKERIIRENNKSRKKRKDRKMVSKIDRMQFLCLWIYFGNTILH